MRVTSRQLVVVAGLLSLTASAGRGVAAQSAVQHVRVTVIEPGGTSRAQWPVQFSIPFPCGVLRDVARLHVRDAAGRELPVQARTLESWPDGSVRWARLDTQLSLDAARPTTIEVESGRRPAPPPRLQVRVADRADFVQVDTGALRFRIPKTHFAVLERMQGEDFLLREGMTSFLVEKGARRQARPPRKVRVVERGPLRVLVEMEGDYGNGIDYVTRVEAFAGKPFVRVRHTFTNRRPGKFVELERIGMDWALGASEPVADYTFGVEGEPPRRGRVGAAGMRAVQRDNLGFRAAGEEESGRLEGWWEMYRRDATVGLAVRWFWQEYPQAVTLKPDRLVYDMWAFEPGAVRIGTGAAKTHEFVVWATPTGKLVEGLGSAAVRFPVATAPPDWLVETGALRGALVPNGPGHRFLERALAGFQEYMERNGRERWDDHGEARCRPGVPGRPRKGAFGMWNWGDWNFPGYRDDTKGCDAWGNLEYDTPQVLALLFAATGSPDVYEAMCAAARHFMDVDIIHFSDRHPEWVGMNHPKNPLHFTFELGGIDLGHTWTEGLISAYRLTGDDRALAAARGIADYLVRRSGSVTLVANPRQWGWPQIALLAVYEATNDERYRRAALEYARRGIRSYRPVPPDHWKLGILADALAHTHAVTGDAEIESWLRRYARSVVRERKHDARFYPAVAYVAALTGDAQLRQAALDRAARLHPGGWGKPFTLEGRIGFRIYSLLADHAATAGTCAARGVRSSPPP